MKFDYLSRSEIDILILEWIHNERDRRILADRLLNGLTYEKLAEKYDLSVRQTKNIVYKCEDILFTHIARK